MKSLPLKYRIPLAIVVVAAVYAFQHWQHAHKADKPAHANIAAQPAPKRKLGALAFEPCILGQSEPQKKSLQAQCTTFQVAENPAQPNGRKLDLGLAWLPPTDDGDSADDPVFFIAGGPGQSAIESYPALDPAFAEIRKKRSVILLDQRGTGKSNLLNCHFPDSDDESDAARAAFLQSLTNCRDELAKKADLRFYTTTDALRDLDAVRQAIGADKIDLVGVSYGTRVAQQYAMRQPQHVRSVILDSVVPNTLILGNIFARNLDDALALQFGQCDKDAACRRTLGQPREELSKLLATLKANPPQVSYRDATSGELRSKALQAGDVAGLVRMFAYMPTVATVLPALIHDANQGHYEALTALTAMLHDNLQDAMAMGMQFSVVCSEDGDQIANSAQDKDTVLGDSLTEVMAAACKVWPKGEMPADFHQPLSTRVPTLVLEGQFDPVTPPRYGEDVVKSLPNGRLFVLRGQGHNVIGAGCMPRLAARFIDGADAKSLDGKCLDALQAPSPFVNFNGWSP